MNKAKIENLAIIDTDNPDYKLSWELYEMEFKFRINYKGSRYSFEDTQVEMFGYLPVLINRLQDMIKSRIDKLENVKKQLNNQFD